MTTDTGKKHRIQFDFSPAAFERLGELKAELGLETNAQVTKAAFQLLEWVVGHPLGMVESKKVLDLIREQAGEGKL